VNLLITNDDGYQSPGIRLLLEKLSVKHDVYLCAPKRQMSASGHAITLFKPMELIRVSEREYAVDGTPADCVKVALYHLYEKVKFDMIVSGVNDGPNMGDDIFYSGTVAAAREGSMNHIFAIAASLDGWKSGKDFVFPAEFIAELVDRISPDMLKENIVLNINFPNLPSVNGVKVTHLGERVYKDFIQVGEKDGLVTVTIAGDDPTFNDDQGSDMNAVSEGFISITPIANEVYEGKVLDRMRFLETAEWRSLQR
jgi:5'-nucleotidase